MFLLIKLFFLSITASENSILKNKNSGLFLLSYSTEQEKCFACETLKKDLKEREIEFTEINFATDLDLAARFFTIFFPSIFYKQVGVNGDVNFYTVNYDDITNGSYNENYILISKYFDPLSLAAIYTSYFVSFTFPYYMLLRDYIEKVPLTIFFIFGSVIFLYFIHSFFQSSSSKKKSE